MAEFPVKYDGNDLDVEHFLRFHPGGANTLKPYKNKDITKQFEEAGHAPSALYLLKNYDVSSAAYAEEKENFENLVNWDEAMLWQVASLGDLYSEWVVSPVDKKLRIFESDFLEYLTHTHWFLIPAIWIPFVIALWLYGFKNYALANGNHNLSTPIALSIFGFFLWPLIEYSIHRWIFHMKPSKKYPATITLHFLLHGLHHKVPFDDKRLLFPPTAAALVIGFFYSVFALFLPAGVVCLLVAGGTLGYVAYDLIHYHLHYGAPQEGTYLYFMKRYHNQHHFRHHESGYGISSPLWDYAFGTVISLRKLTRVLRW